jgi:hypothetical protein
MKKGGSIGRRRTRRLSKNTGAESRPMSTTTDADTDVHVVKFGVNYRFGYGKAPVMAKY